MKFNDIIKDIRKETGGKSAEDSQFAKETGYISTGFYAINRVISSDIYKGIPEGRITTFAGESQSGKSWIVANIIKNALAPVEQGGNGYQGVFYLDSEGGGLFDFMKGLGVDLGKIMHIPVVSVEDCSVQLLKIYDMLVKAREEYDEDPNSNDEPKFLVVLDSFGALAADKLVNDAVDKDQMVQDMGITARLKNNMIVGVMMRVVKSNCAFIVINHVYDNPGAMFTSKIKEMPGGKRLVYGSHVVVQTSMRRIKVGDKDFYFSNKELDRKDRQFYAGSELRFYTVKNRICQPALEASVYQDYNSGVCKYEGLVEDAVKMGFIEKKWGGKWLVPSYDPDKTVAYEDLITNDKIWDTFIKDFNEKSIKQVAYHSQSEQALDDLEKDIASGNNEPAEPVVESTRVKE